MKKPCVYSITLNQLCLSTGLLLSLFSSFVFGLTEALGPEGIRAYAVHEKGITGDGVNIGLLSKGNARDGHIAFDRHGSSAVTLHDFTGSGLERTNHDTHMAGILISAGSPVHPEQIGVAPGAHVHSARISTQRIYEALDALILKHHCRVIVTGIQVAGLNATANGDSILSKLYDYYAETYDVIFANAAGNLSPQITVFGDCYNGITTAGMVKDLQGRYSKAGSASNAGPTADHRHKPDVGAPTQGLFVPSSRGDNFWDTIDGNGRGLTSYAVPHTAGVTALLLETAGKTPQEDDDRSEVIKAVIVNSTQTRFTDANDLTGNPADSTTAWNAQSGYGRLDALRAYETLTGGRIQKDGPAGKVKGWAYDTIKAQSDDVYHITGKKGQRLITTVTWHRKLKKLPNQMYMEAYPKFYLNLKIISPTDKTVVFEPAGRDNLIKVDHLFETDGDYKIVLRNPTLADGRDYGIAFEVVEISATVDEN